MKLDIEVLRSEEVISGILMIQYPNLALENTILVRQGRSRLRLV